MLRIVKKFKNFGTYANNGSLKKLQEYEVFLMAIDSARNALSDDVSLEFKMYGRLGVMTHPEV